MQFDSRQWRATRDAKLMEWLQDPHAVQFVVLFSDACELFDDLIDKDKPLEDGHVVRVLFGLLTEMPVNPFFDRWKAQLVPLIITGINAWLDANELEQGDENDKVFAYVLRDWYMEFLSFVIYATRGREVMRELSMDVRRFFTHHETLEQYMEKLS
ncbi:MAG: hypothetical protein RIB80_04605 [Rhodospirillales bacterium]